MKSNISVTKAVSGSNAQHWFSPNQEIHEKFVNVNLDFDGLTGYRAPTGYHVQSSQSDGLASKLQKRGLEDGDRQHGVWKRVTTRQ